MRTSVTRSLAAAAALAALTVGLAATSASATTPDPAAHPAASHAPSRIIPNCVIDGDNDCVQTVSGTPWGSTGSAIRSTPHTSATQVGGIPYGAHATVYCYTTGDNVSGDSFWDYVYYNGVWGYADDYWLNTGGNINQQVDPC